MKTEENAEAQGTPAARLRRPVGRGHSRRRRDDRENPRSLANVTASIRWRRRFFEYTDALGKFLPDSDRPNEGVFSLTDDDDQWLEPALRSDPRLSHVTWPRISTKSSFPIVPIAPVTFFRNEKSGPAASASSCSSMPIRVGAPAYRPMPKWHDDGRHDGGLGIARGDYVIRVNNRKVTRRRSGGDRSRRSRADEYALTVLRAIDKLDKFGPQGVRLFAG